MQIFRFSCLQTKAVYEQLIKKDINIIPFSI
jgi:hypothetical protein